MYSPPSWGVIVFWLSKVELCQNVAAFTFRCHLLQTKNKVTAVLCAVGDLEIESVQSNVGTFFSFFFFSSSLITSRHDLNDWLMRAEQRASSVSRPAFLEGRIESGESRRCAADSIQRYKRHSPQRQTLARRGSCSGGGVVGVALHPMQFSCRVPNQISAPHFSLKYANSIAHIPSCEVNHSMRTWFQYI